VLNITLFAKIEVLENAPVGEKLQVLSNGTELDNRVLSKTLERDKRDVLTNGIRLVADNRLERVKKEEGEAKLDFEKIDDLDKALESRKTKLSVMQLVKLHKEVAENPRLPVNTEVFRKYLDNVKRLVCRKVEESRNTVDRVTRLDPENRFDLVNRDDGLNDGVELKRRVEANGELLLKTRLTDRTRELVSLMLVVSLLERRKTWLLDILAVDEYRFVDEKPDVNVKHELELNRRDTLNKIVDVNRSLLVITLDLVRKTVSDI
jgi:hypothetical protein